MPVTRRRPANLHLTALIAVLGCLLGTPLGVARASTGTVSLLIKTKAPLTPSLAASISSKVIQTSYVWPEIRAMAVEVSPSKVASLAADPKIELVETDYSAGVTDDPADSLSATAAPPAVTVPTSTSSTPIITWNQDMANTPGPFETGAGVTVAVIDAGLPQNWQTFLPADKVDLTYAAGFGPMGWGLGNAAPAAIQGVGGHMGLFPHCVAVSSIIVGFPSDFGFIAGAAPDAHILPVRTIDQFNFGHYSWFTAGVMYVANLKASGAIPGPMVVNFSIEGHNDSQVLKDAIDYAISQGIIFVTIAGNYNPFSTVSFPGRLPECITVGAAGWSREGMPPDPWFFGDVNENDPSEVYVAPFSGREPPTVPAGSMIDVLAPGSNVFGEWLYGPGYSEGREIAFDAVSNFIYGTSFAGPHVVGIVARMLQKNPLLTQSDVEAILKSTALPIPPSSPYSYYYPWDERATGAGLVQGAEAVAATPLPPHLQPWMGWLARSSANARPSLRVVTRAGGLPVKFLLAGFGNRPCTWAVYDVQGRLVRRWISSGSVQWSWDGIREDGSRAASGIYFVRAEGEGLEAGSKLVIVR